MTTDSPDSNDTPQPEGDPEFVQPTSGDNPVVVASEAGPEAQTATEIVEWSPLPKPGPGLLEALLVVLGAVLLQVIGVAVAAIVIVVVRLARGARVTEDFLRNIEKDYATEVACTALLSFLVGAIVYTVVRLGFRLRQRLAVGLIPPGHCLLMLFVFVPLAIVCGNLQTWMLEAYSRLSAEFPFLPNFDELQAIEVVTDLAKSLSLPMLVLLIAAVPAIGEELIFRGVIGRGLVARWGLIPGVLLTSVLFGLVHLHPAQAVGVFPLAVVFHIVYLATRSIWAPMLLHFLNNSLAVVMLQGIEDAEVGADQTFAPPGVTIAATLAVAAIVALIWQTRARFEMPDGSLWNPGYETAELPPRDLPVTRTYLPANRRLIAFCTISFCAFLAACVFWS